MGFDKGKGLVGGGWVLRNERGVVLFHSRRAFSGCRNREDAKLVVVNWVIENMRSQRISKVIFAGEFGDLFGATTHPKAWPSFQFQSSVIRKELEGIQEWKLLVINREANECAFFIAQSVTNQGLVNLYVARGHPNGFSNSLLMKLGTSKGFLLMAGETSVLGGRWWAEVC